MILGFVLQLVLDLLDFVICITTSSLWFIHNIINLLGFKLLYFIQNCLGCCS